MTSLKELSIIIVIVIAGLAAAVGYLSSRFLPPDSAPEQVAELAIKATTGMSVDFSTDSPAPEELSPQSAKTP